MSLFFLRMQFSAWITSYRRHISPQVGVLVAYWCHLGIHLVGDPVKSGLELHQYACSSCIVLLLKVFNSMHSVQLKLQQEMNLRMEQLNRDQYTAWMHFSYYSLAWWMELLFSVQNHGHWGRLIFMCNFLEIKVYLSGCGLTIFMYIRLCVTKIGAWFLLSSVITDINSCHFWLHGIFFFVQSGAIRSDQSDNDSSYWHRVCYRHWMLEDVQLFHFSQVHLWGTFVIRPTPTSLFWSISLELCRI